MPKNKNEQFWQYDAFSGLISQFQSEEIAIYYAESRKDLIVFIASLHDIQEYPYQEGNKTVLGPNTVREGHFVTVNGRAFGKYPWKDGTKTILGPDIVLEGHIVTVNGRTFYQTCNAWVILNKTQCIMPYLHRSNQHEDKDGNVVYA